MDITRAFPSKYLKSEDIAGDTPVTIQKVVLESVEEGEPELPIVYFLEFQKGLVLNKTNATTIASLYGPETDEWTGRLITLFPSETSFQGRMVPCLRVRSTPTTAAPTTPPSSAGEVCGACGEIVPAVTRDGICSACVKASRATEEAVNTSAT